MTILELYCVGSILHLISWLLVAWLFPEQAIGPAGRNIRKGAEGQVENESRRVMIPFYQNNSNAPSTREEAGLIIYMDTAPDGLSPQLLSPFSIDSGGVNLQISIACSSSLSSSVDGGESSRLLSLSATFPPHVWLVREQVITPLPRCIVAPPLLRHSRREPIWPIL